MVSHHDLRKSFLHRFFGQGLLHADVFALLCDFEVECDTRLIRLDGTYGWVWRARAILQSLIVVAAFFLVCATRVIGVALHELVSTRSTHPEMLSDIWVQVLPLHIYHTVQDDSAFSLAKPSLRVLLASPYAVSISKVFH